MSPNEALQTWNVSTTVFLTTGRVLVLRRCSFADQNPGMEGLPLAQRCPHTTRALALRAMAAYLRIRRVPVVSTLFFHNYR